MVYLDKPNDVAGYQMTCKWGENYLEPRVENAKWNMQEQFGNGMNEMSWQGLVHSSWPLQRVINLQDLNWASAHLLSRLFLVSLPSPGHTIFRYLSKNSTQFTQNLEKLIVIWDHLRLYCRLCHHGCSALSAFLQLSRCLRTDQSTNFHSEFLQITSEIRKSLPSFPLFAFLLFFFFGKFSKLSTVLPPHHPSEHEDLLP